VNCVAAAVNSSFKFAKPGMFVNIPIPDSNKVRVPVAVSLQGVFVELIIKRAKDCIIVINKHTQNMHWKCKNNLRDSLANLLINRGVMATLQELHLGYHSQAGLEPETSRFLALSINHFATPGIICRKYA
jgi:hypothetical protein